MSPELKDQIEQRERVFKQVAELLISVLKLDRTSAEIDPDTPLFGTGLGLDSVDAVEIIVALESEFGISLDESEGRVALRTINSLVDLVLEREKAGLVSSPADTTSTLFFPQTTEALHREEK